MLVKENYHNKIYQATEEDEEGEAEEKKPKQKMVAKTHELTPHHASPFSTS